MIADGPMLEVCASTATPALPMAAHQALRQFATGETDPPVMGAAGGGGSTD